MLPTSAAGGGATSFYRQVRSADGLRRQRAAIVLGVAMGLSSLPIIMQTLVVRQGDGRTVMTVLLVALGLLSGGAAFLASRGFASIAGLWLTLIPCWGALGSVLLSRELGSAPFLGALGVAVAMVTLAGRALWWGLGLSVLSTLAMAALGATGELAPTPMRLVLVTSVVLVALVALAVAISTRSFDNLLREVASQQEHAADVEARYRLIAENTTARCRKTSRARARSSVASGTGRSATTTSSASISGWPAPPSER